MANMTFPTGNTGSAPTAARSSNLLLDDGTNTGSATVSTVLGLINQTDIPGFKSSGSNVNYFLITPKATGANPSIEVVGSDTNIGIDISGKGSGLCSFYTRGNFNAGADFSSNIKLRSGGSPYMQMDVDSSTGYLKLTSTDGTRNFVDNTGTVSIGAGGSLTGPTISGGSAVPSGAPAGSGTAGSIYLRTGGGANTSLYIYYGSAWHAVTG